MHTATVSLSRSVAQALSPPIPQPLPAQRPIAVPARETRAGAPTARPGSRITERLALIETELQVTRRVVRAGDFIYRSGDAFNSLCIVHAGLFKTVNVSRDGREQVVGLYFKGDWLGFDGMADGRFGCDAIAMDTSEVWIVRYDAVLAACSRLPLLMADMHAAMSRELARDRDSMLALCTLSADARVADFLRNWARTLEERGLRTDRITLRMTRAEIGNLLGMKLETVSRALSRLARDGHIAFSERGRRDIEIPSVAALATFIERSLSQATVH